MNVEDLKRFCKIESKSDFIVIHNELDTLKIRFNFFGLKFNFNKCQ